MSRKTVLLQTIVDPDVAQWAREQARESKQSTAAWLRLLIENQREAGASKSLRRRVDELERRVARLEASK